MSDDDGLPVGSVGTSFELVEALYASEGGRGVTELATEVGISKSAAHKQLRTLVDLGYVEQREGDYRLTLRFLDVGRTVQQRRSLYRIARPIVDDLADSSGAVTNLMVLEDGYGAYLYRAGEALTDTPFHEGQRCYLHASGAGKAILATLDRSEAESILDRRGLPALTDKTLTDRDELIGELQSIRERGLAFDRGEHVDGWQCVAAPIAPTGDPVGALSVSGRTHHMSGKTLSEDVAGLLVSAANEVEVSLLRD